MATELPFQDRFNVASLHTRCIDFSSHRYADFVYCLLVMHVTVTDYPVLGKNVMHDTGPWCKTIGDR